MAKKNKEKQKFIYEKDLDNYYALNSEAVDKLVNTTEDNAPEVGAAEIKQYKSSGLSKIPMWLKALFIKFWFNGAVCFFFLWGLSAIISDWWDQILIVGLAMGVVTDLLVNNAFRFIADEPNSNDKWMMIPQKKFWTLFANILYALVVFSVVILIYHGINMALVGADPDMKYDFTNFVGVEPIGFGLLYLAVDMVFVGIKDLFVKIIRDLKAKSAKQTELQKESIAQEIPSHSEVFFDKNSSPDSETACDQPSSETHSKVTVVHQVTNSSKKSKKNKRK